jgi:hypothetical protein
LGGWNVPDAPKRNRDQLLYIFTGLQDEDWIPSLSANAPPTKNFDIIQPV